MHSDDSRIDKLIASEQFHHFPGTNITVCGRVTHASQQIVDVSIGADNTEFDLPEGQRRARNGARKRLANLESYVERCDKVES